MIFQMSACCGSFIGNERKNNEDNFYFNKKHLPVPNKGLKNPVKCCATTEESQVFAIFDGMGGECKGDEAALVAAEIFAENSKKLSELALSGKEFMLDSCEKANAAVNKRCASQNLTSMGTTVAALYFSQDEVVACNVGDSRIFRIRDKQMIQISEDHTDEKIMSAVGISKKPVLLQYVGIRDTEMVLEPYVSKGEICCGDVYVLCSDGVTDVLTPWEIYEIIGRYGDPNEAVKQILAEVDKKGGGDNSTVIVIVINEMEE